MFSTTFEQMLENMGSLRPLVERVASSLDAYPNEAVVDPAVLAYQAKLSDVQLLAALNVLRKAGLGRFEVAVLNDRGQPVAFYPDADSVDETVTDDYGAEFSPQPKDLRVVFRPNLRGPAARER